MPDWEFEEINPRYIEQELTQRDQFNNDEVTLAEAIVREVIQNSADAAADGAPVKVRFNSHQVAASNAKRFRQIFETLRPHLRACGISPLEAIDENAPRVLVVEDFATKGLTGDPGAPDGGNFHSFWRRHGKSGKSGKAGGRWGLGKLVYSTSSDIRCFFGLTVRAGDEAPLLMGQAVLANHELNHKRYVAHGFWFGSRNAIGMQMPVADAAFTKDFAELAGIARTTQTGLSIVIPFINAKITDDVIIRGVIENYYFPILAGRLIVEVGSTVIDAGSFFDVARRMMKSPNDNPERYAFVQQVSERLSAKPMFETQLPAAVKPLSAELFADTSIATMKAIYGKGELVHVRMPIRLRRKSGEEKISRVDLFLRAPPENSRPFSLFARGSITVPGETRYFSGANAYGAFVALHEDVVSFLGDAENPAHTTWSGTAEKLNANWRSPGQALKILRYALWELYTIVSDQGDRKDKDALIDFFSLADPAKSESKKKGKTTGVPPNLPPAEKAYRIQKRGQGGFAIVPGPGAAAWTYPKSIRVRVAYDLIGANPFNRHSPLDFDLAGSSIKIEARNINVTTPEANVLELSVAAPDFILEAKGFDLNRDLVVDAKARP
ncbi:hypothetical protein [Bradyrhizobium japonicum]|uniref:hypothetical protein n=1 Tax=Bradyrhizobium japonicum TaxID=375 RepID=UPI000456BFE8|nr:hypothetical protein [Bradyrhizobium japonicum]AHY50517.1 hypothetical protein BJS_03365 [Bradyrhizobium japonicum SEMIA 5079]MCD9109964.1 hypothetical protein [Bradyrhizobium japonicum]MCD9259573.1 hypothetical protein [Bradyrhizobium japonicum SEMIA 5079]MCD9910425.1 hypothetical protein [Bradyrhizobium japonicum]MCS3977548.1 hypothetical protein [Bradyrhizobium japonicum]